MSESLSPEQVAIMIRARQILKDKGLAADTDITGICKAAGISRKTGYQWAEKHINGSVEWQKDLERKLAQLQSDYDKLHKDFDEVSFENRGRKLAWEIHRVEELLAAQKNTSVRKKSKKR